MKLPSLATIKAGIVAARKAVVAVAGVAALLASSGLLHGTAEAVVNVVVAAATALGVYRVPNSAHSA